jgi:hypothetical protein
VQVQGLLRVPMGVEGRLCYPGKRGKLVRRGAM